MPIARYAMVSSDSTWMFNTWIDVSSALALGGFDIAALVADGASENRTWFSVIATHSLNDVMDLENAGDLLFLDDLRGSGVDLDFKVATIPPGSDKLCFILSDPPHMIKKIANALDASSGGKSRSLKVPMSNKGGGDGDRLVDVSLEMGKNAWQQVDPSWEGGLRKWRKLSLNVFEKDRFSKMRVGLAARAVGNSMVEVIEQNREDGKDAVGALDAYYDMARLVNGAWVCMG
jgi:hypothetical protein